MNIKFQNKKYFSRNSNWQLTTDSVLVFLLASALILNFFRIIPATISSLFIGLSIIGASFTIRSAILSLLQRKITIDLLASVALVFSFLAGEWSSAVFINLMLASARIFDKWTEMRAKNIVENLLKYRPTKVRVEKNGKIEEIPIDKVRVGDLIIIESGDRIAIDGTVVSGQASINQATLTGESEPVAKTVGDEVYTSTLNESGSLIVKTEKIGEDTTLAKITTLIGEASRDKTKTERIADKFATWFIVMTFFGSIVLFFIYRNVNMVLAILLVTCADDIAVSIPLAFTLGIVKAGKLGVIVKGGDIIEALTKIKVFVADKTGTLTRGRPKIKEVRTFDDFKERKFWELLGMAEISSRHPAGRAIIRHIRKEGIDIPAPDEANELPGQGIEAAKGNEKVFAGKLSYLEANKVKIKAEEKRLINEIKESGDSVTALSLNGRLIGIIVLEDELRPGVEKAIRETKNLGIKKWIMLTGDNEKVAANVASTLGIDEFKANLLPEDKVNFVRDLKTKHKSMAVIGDGVNDAAALALADVGFAMAAIGSDAAIEASDVALMHDEVKRLPEIFILGKRVMKTVNLNFVIWGVTNAVGLTLVLTGVFGPVEASAFNFITDFLPIFNSLSILTPKSR